MTIAHSLGLNLTEKLYSTSARAIQRNFTVINNFKTSVIQIHAEQYVPWF
jgi:hypothetical protein